MLTEAGLLSENERRRGTGLASVFFSSGAGICICSFRVEDTLAEPAARWIQCSESTLCWSEALGRETLRASPPTKQLLTEANPVLAWASLKWLMYCGLEALARGNSSFLSLRGFSTLWRSRRYFLQLASCYYNQHLVLVFCEPEGMCLI